MYACDGMLACVHAPIYFFNVLIPNSIFYSYSTDPSYICISAVCTLSSCSFFAAKHSLHMTMWAAMNVTEVAIRLCPKQMDIYIAELYM